VSAASRLFGAGIGGTELSRFEREIFEEHPPCAVILFHRNIGTADQLQRLASEVRRLAGSPWLCVDQEGGPVDRFRDLLGPSISLRAAAGGGSARRAGELAGEVCARFGIAVDLAPVVDRAVPGAAAEVLGERVAGEDPETVAAAAADFLEGLHSRGVGGCLKHFPGLGRASLDTHFALPVLAEDAGEAARDLHPFARTMEKAGAVMISHAAGEDGVPASLSRARATDLLRGRLGFAGAAFSDDLEMGALAAFGGLPERCAEAARAGCDLLFICKEIEGLPECVRAVEGEVPAERVAEASARLDQYADHLARLARSAVAPKRPLAELIADMRHFAASVAGI